MDAIADLGTLISGNATDLFDYPKMRSALWWCGASRTPCRTRLDFCTRPLADPYSSITELASVSIYLTRSQPISVDRIRSDETKNKWKKEKKRDLQEFYCNIPNQIDNSDGRNSDSTIRFQSALIGKLRNPMDLSSGGGRFRLLSKVNPC